ncbi:hypothetical protein CPF11_03400 [Acetobacter pomorum]|nr:hypothetical protein CPF11_03400 [Acetobacter pomorum]
MPSFDQTIHDFAFRAHLLLDYLYGLAFVAAVDSSTDTRPTSSWIVDERDEVIELVLCQVDMDAPTNDRLIAREIDL